MRVFGWISGIAALLALGLGALSLSNATLGVGGIAVGCWLLIATRIFQASAHHDEALKAVRGDRSSAAGTRICPGCHRVIGARATQCPHCGAELPDLAKTIRTVTTGTDAQKNCQHCGTAVHWKADTCPHCGQNPGAWQPA